MGSIFKKTITRHKLDGRTVKAGTPNSVKVSEKTTKWYGQYLDKNGRTRTKSLSTDKQIARTMLSNLERQVDRHKAGLATSFDEHLARPLTAHLQDYLAHLRAKDNTSDYIAAEKTRITRILAGCHFSYIRDFVADRVLPFVNEQRECNPKFGVRTANHHIRAIKGFAIWLVKNQRMPHNPFGILSRFNPKLEPPRHPRRSLSPSDLQRLLEATKASSRTDTGDDWEFTPQNRYMLYQVAVFTGLRARELSSLTRRSFNFTSEPQTITVEAAYSKHRREDVLPLHPELSDIIQEWITGKPKDQNLWPGTWAEKRKGHKIIKRDLQEASIPYCDDYGNFDFHSLRGQFITDLVRSDLHPKEAQDLARHSTITLTMDYYTKLTLHDTSAALSKLSRKPKPTEQHNHDVA